MWLESLHNFDQLKSEHCGDVADGVDSIAHTQREMMGWARAAPAVDPIRNPAIEADTRVGIADLQGRSGNALAARNHEFQLAVEGLCQP